MSQKSRHAATLSTERLCSGGCARPAFDTFFLCHDCADTLWRHLLKVAEPARDGQDHPGRSLIDELNITIAGQARVASRNIGIVVRSATTPLPWNERASQAYKRLTDILIGWAHTTAGYHGTTLNTVFYGPTDAANWLLRYHNQLRGMDISGQAYEEIVEAIREAERAVDRPGDRQYAGPCVPACGGEVYGRPDGTIAKCNECDAEYDLAQRRQWLLNAAQDYLVTAAEASRALPDMLGRPLSVKTIRTWMNTGRLASIASNEGPLHRVGDIVHLAVVTRMRRRGPTVQAERDGELLDTPA